MPLPPSAAMMNCFRPAPSMNHNSMSSNSNSDTSNMVKRPPIGMAKPPMHPMPHNIRANKGASSYPKIVSSNYKPVTNGFHSNKVKPIEVSLKLPLSKSNSVDHMRSYDSRESSYISRSPSPMSSRSSLSSMNASDSYRSRSSNSNGYTRRLFPQSYAEESAININEYNSLEQSPVVFDANLSFLLGCQRQSVHQTFRPSPAHEDPTTASNYLSTKIQDFLKRTDHVMEEWKCLGRRNRDDDTISLIERQRENNPRLGRSRSVTNIMIKSYQLSQNLPPTSCRSPSINRDFSDDRTILDEDDEVNKFIYIFICGTF